MEVHENLANDIVHEMKKIIGKNINYIHTDGKIIASTDPERVGNYHEGASLVSKKKSMLIIDYDFQYLGAKKGINLPVCFNEEIIGVIGISGERKEVEKYGQIIKKMTEILIKDSYIQAREEQEVEFEKIKLEKLLLEENQRQEILIVSDTLEEFYLKEEGLVLTLAFQKTNKDNFDKRKKIFEYIRMLIQRKQGYIMRKNSFITILLFKKTRKELEDILSKIVNILKNEKEEFSIGIGEVKKQSKDLKKSYQESIISLEWAIKSKKEIIFYEDMNLEILLNHLEEGMKQEYVKRIFQNLTADEIKEYCNILLCYEKNNGSLDKTAKELFIHRNTLQYKINRLRDKIGLDMRKYHDFTLLKLASLM